MPKGLSMIRPGQIQNLDQVFENSGPVSFSQLHAAFKDNYLWFALCKLLISSGPLLPRL